MLSADVNWLAVVVSTVSAMVIGAAWYSPILFYKQWMAAVGKTNEELQKNAAAQGYVVTAIAWFVVAYVLSHFADYADVSTLTEGMQVGFWVWLGFVATTSAINGVFSGRGWKLWSIDNGYHLVSLLVMGGLIAQLG